MLISAESFDAGWSAYDQAGSALEVVPTALGQIAVLVPVARAIEQSDIRLVHRDPWVRVGAGVTWSPFSLSASPSPATARPV